MKLNNCIVSKSCNEKQTKFCTFFVKLIFMSYYSLFFVHAFDNTNPIDVIIYVKEKNQVWPSIVNILETFENLI